MLAELLTRRRAARPDLKSVFDAHKDRVFTVALVCLNGDHAAAEDAAQEVFVRLAGRLGQFRGEAKLSTWLHQVTVNICRDEQRRRQRAQRLTVDTVEQQPEVAPSVDFLSRRELHVAIETLPENLRAPVLLRYFEGLSYEEIATVLDCPQGTVATRLHRGLKRLAIYLGEEEIAP